MTYKEQPEKHHFFGGAEGEGGSCYFPNVACLVFYLISLTRRITIVGGTLNMEDYIGAFYHQCLHVLKELPHPQHHPWLVSN